MINSGEKHAEESHGHGQRREEQQQRRFQRRLAADHRRAVRQYAGTVQRPVRHKAAVHRAHHSDLWRWQWDGQSIAQSQGSAVEEVHLAGDDPRRGHSTFQTDQTEHVARVVTDTSKDPDWIVHLLSLLNWVDEKKHW